MFAKSISAVVLLGLSILGVGTVAITPATFGIDWFEPAETRIENRILSQLRANGVYDDPGKRFVIRAKHVDGADLRGVTIQFRSNAKRSVVADRATLSVQPDEYQVRLAASSVTFRDDGETMSFDDLEWTLDADGGWPLAAW